MKNNSQNNKLVSIKIQEETHENLKQIQHEYASENDYKRISFNQIIKNLLQKIMPMK